jgi:hypothetical protein
MTPPGPVIFLHIYKTGGQTLHRSFVRNYPGESWLPMYVGPMGLPTGKAEGSSANPGWIAEEARRYVRARATPRTRCVFGHFAYYGLHELLPTTSRPRYATFLREPVERVISLYYYLRNSSVNAWHDEIVHMDWSLAEWFERTPALWIRNGQVRQLLIGTYPDVETERELTREHLAEAQARLADFWFVGFTESFAQDAARLYRRLAFAQLEPGDAVNVTPGKEPVPEAIRRRIAGDNALDLALYDYARQLRRRSPARRWLAAQQPRLRALWRSACRVRGRRPTSDADAAGRAPG